jgi:hypothetical protein
MKWMVAEQGAGSYKGNILKILWIWIMNDAFANLSN